MRAPWCCTTRQHATAPSSPSFKEFQIHCPLAPPGATLPFYPYHLHSPQPPQPRTHARTHHAIKHAHTQTNTTVRTRTPAAGATRPWGSRRCGSPCARWLPPPPPAAAGPGPPPQAGSLPSPPPRVPRQQPLQLQPHDLRRRGHLQQAHTSQARGAMPGLPHSAWRQGLLLTHIANGWALRPQMHAWRR